MNSYWIISGILLVLLGLAHSFFGEWLIFKHKRKKGSIVPTIVNTDLRQRHLRIMWANWHFTTILGWCLAFILIRLGLNPGVLPLEVTLWIIQASAAGTLLGSLLVLFATKGRHPGWLALLVITFLIVIGLLDKT
jgi:hypothetical protein